MYTVSLHADFGTQDCAAVKMYLYIQCVCMQTLLPRIVQPSKCIYTFNCMIVQTVELVDLTEMRKTVCFGKTRFVPHVPSSLCAGIQIYYYFTIFSVFACRYCYPGLCSCQDVSMCIVSLHVYSVSAYRHCYPGLCSC